jgi:hypothetical protein
MKRSSRGSHAELRGLQWLIENNFFAFKAVSPHGPVDIIRLKGNQIVLYNVKAVFSGRRKRPPIGSTIDYLLVSEDGSCEVVPALPPVRRSLPLRDRRPLGRRGATLRSRTAVGALNH